MEKKQIAIVDANDLTRTGWEYVAQSIGMRGTDIHSFREPSECERFIKGYAVDAVLIGEVYYGHIPKVTQLIRRWVTRFEGLLVIMASDGFSVTGVRNAYRAGARAFLDIRDDLRQSLMISLTLSSGGHYHSPSVDMMMKRRMEVAEIAELSDSDLDILHLLARGMNNQEIASLLGVTVRSLYRVRGRLRAALQVRTNEQIVDEARRRGMI